MNKFEKLIEYIINDDDQKARALFHEIVVEKSRDIYESIMDEEVHGNQVEELTDELDKEESIGEDEDEFASDDMGDDMGGEEEVGDEFGGEEEPADEFGGEEEAGDDKIMNIDAKLDELLAKFDEIMGDTGGEEDFGGEEEPADDMGSEEMPMDDMGAEPEQEQFAEAKSGSGNPFAKGSGKSGSAVSGKSGSAKSGTSGKSGSATSGKSGNPFAKKTESKQSTTELMREYVDRIGDIYGGAGDESEGTAVGATGKKTSVNGRSITGPGADFGGSTIKRTGADNANPDGKSAPSSDKPQQIKSGNINVPGGKAGGAFKSKEAGKPAEGSTTDGSVSVDKQSVLRQNSGK
jgi:hypothetical protein